MKPRLLWVGDAAVASGFAKVTHNVLDNLPVNWDIHVLGVNYYGEPYSHNYPIYPCRTPYHGDAFGSQRLPDLIKQVKPDIVVIQTDPWNAGIYLDAISGGVRDFNVVGVIPVDGKNCKGKQLNRFDHVIFWTEFAFRQANLGGFRDVPHSVIPLGVDLSKFQRKQLVDSRQKFGLPESVVDGYIVGNVNRNQPRKRLDLTISVFAEWIRKHGVDDAFLLLHAAPTGDVGYNLVQLAHYYNVFKNLILIEPDMAAGIPEIDMVHVYNSMNVQITTTQGEGWGLTTMEGMACGVPQIIPNWAALPEWTQESCLEVNCYSTICTPNGINAVGGVASRDELVAALAYLYDDVGQRRYFSNEGMNLVEQPRYRWEEISKQYQKVFDNILTKKPMEIEVG